MAADGGSLHSYRVGEAPGDTDTEWQRQCALCRVTVHHVQHWQPATNSLVSYPWDKNAIGSFSASRRIEGEKDVRLSRPQASAGEVLRRAVTVPGRSPWGLKKGRGGYRSSSPMYTSYSLHPSPIRHEVDLSSSGGDGRVGKRERGQCRGEEKEAGHDWTPPKASLLPSPQASLFGELSTHQDARGESHGGLHLHAGPHHGGEAAIPSDATVEL